MVGRLMPCSPGSRIPSGLPRLAKLTDAAPGWLAAHLREGLTVATTARTTRFCRTHGPPFRRSFPSPVDGAGNLQTRRSLAAPLVGTRLRAHRDYPPCPHLSCPTLPRPPQARLAISDDTRSPLKDEPGWATHTPFPNFGKVEYFCGERIDGGRHRPAVARMERSVIRGCRRCRVAIPDCAALHPGYGLREAPATGSPRWGTLLPLSAGYFRGGNHGLGPLSTPSFCRIAETCALMVASETPSS